MDTDLLKTFLEVKTTRHFGKAAENLFLTQAAVSARIKQLERTIGSALFIRYRNNLQLTATGERFVPHAQAILIAWDRAQQDIMIEHCSKQLISIGATSGLWEACLKKLPALLSTQLGHLLLRAESLAPEILTRRLMERTLDLAILYDHAKLNQLCTVKISDSNLNLVSTVPGLSAEQDLTVNQNPFDERDEGSIAQASAMQAALEERSAGWQYVAIDWGTAFNIEFAKYFSSQLPVVLHTNQASIALEYLLSVGGCAYLPASLTAPWLNNKLFYINDAPSMPRPVYALYHEENQKQSQLLQIVNTLEAKWPL